MNQAINLEEFQQMFSDEQECIDYLIATRWPDGFICPKCQGTRSLYITKRRAFLCSNANCRTQTAITSETIFNRSRTPLWQWFAMIYLVANFGTELTYAQLQRLVDINTYQTCRRMTQRIRRELKNPRTEDVLKGIIDLTG